MIRLTAIVNAHREGALLHPTLVSVARACERALEDDLTVDCLVVADRADDTTLEVAEGFAFPCASRVIPVDLGDLGRARNAGVEKARGDYVAFIDGDDLMADDWLIGAAEVAAAQTDQLFVIRPELIMIFGAEAPYIHVHIESTSPTFDTLAFTVENCWTAITMAPRSLHERFPFYNNETEGGFAYEDWSWSAELLGAGVRHLVAQHTIGFVRRKHNQSLLKVTNKNPCVPRLSGAHQLLGMDHDV